MVRVKICAGDPAVLETLFDIISINVTIFHLLCGMNRDLYAADLDASSNLASSVSWFVVHLNYTLYSCCPTCFQSPVTFRLDTEVATYFALFCFCERHGEQSCNFIKHHFDNHAGWTTAYTSVSHPRQHARTKWHISSQVVFRFCWVGKKVSLWMIAWIVFTCSRLASLRVCRMITSC